MNSGNIKLVSNKKEYVLSSAKEFNKENFVPIKKVMIAEENKHIFLWNPENHKPKQRPVKLTHKIIHLTIEESIRLIKGMDKENKETDKNKKTNLCTFTKADGKPCGAKLKCGNKYCLRHMKMAKVCPVINKS